MQTLRLGKTGLTVSELCLGTMTWGSQNTEAEGHAQADAAVDRGITFWDTAEMYPTNPVKAETVGGTEAIIGTWLASRGGRERLQIATKITGKGAIVRPGQPITGATMRAAVEGSLRRLQTDYIDLYQLHWPNRGSYHFRQMWTYAPTGTDKATETAHMVEVLTTAQALVAEGKVRAIGLSNESVWGAARWLHLAETLGLPAMGTVQNEYSLLCRQFDTDWAEFSVAEDMPLLAFSPLACGLLSGKYAGGVVPEGTRRSFTPDLGGRMTARVLPAVAACLDVAARHGLDPCQMAIAFCRSRPFTTIPIIGATTLAQLEVNMGAAGLVLGAEVLADIAQTHRACPAPY
ncbi:MAG: aldo/keto reductase [Tabrizicola sp.]|uniref:aldo/keto reductase n=1 Tax=Tabrizicola sp. TaxID=2005166 RepID=UPI0027341291|nr:aldo/keto reductase [Tabrizicola sp.]MDP3261395.1 aldo/keto reductase [Tabrizicola sp.]MDP3649184.1 aldo/keto reductase [Paracoccaceae bacterium]MDZ4065989.1 aldo/keto reductase [Tabrizicola sp.]